MESWWSKSFVFRNEWKFLLGLANGQAQSETKKPLNHQTADEEPRLIPGMGKRNVGEQTWLILCFAKPFLISF